MATGQDTRNIRVFISYLNQEPSRTRAALLAEVLEQRLHFNVFFDANKLRPQGGVQWDETLFQEARNASVLLILLQPDTATSDWVKHEVSTARGAHVSILPILINGNVTEAMRTLAIDRLQYRKFDDLQLNWESLAANIESLSAETLDRQNQWLRMLDDLRRTEPPVRNEPKRASFALNEIRRVKVHIALGDMTAPEMGAIDVLVNTENDHMQMARVFESHTLSSKLRYLGSLIEGRVYLKEDTVQQELDAIIEASTELRRPVPKTSVIVTHAGHPKSKLHRKKLANGDVVGARFIFHVASVSVSQLRKNQIEPVKAPDEIIACVRNALDQVLDVDAAQGLTIPTGRPFPRSNGDVSANESYQAIKSIILPLFGAGRGGNHASFVIPHMIRGIQNFLLDNQTNTDLKLEDIYLCIFSESDVNAAKQTFIDAGFKLL